MPIPIPTHPTPPLFPSLSVQQIDAARLSAWYETFQDLTIPSIVIDLDELGEKEAFIQWLDSESIFMPLETIPVEAEREGEGSVPRHYLPNLGRRIREVIFEYGGGVFPKLNWTAPRDAAFLLPQTSEGPLYCTSPEDIYLLLKSSDFLTHAITPERVYEGCDSNTIPGKGEMKLELILRKYESNRINPSREFRCFVRNDILLGASVRDFNYYSYYQEHQVLETVAETLRSFYEDEIMGDYGGGSDYTFDVILDETHNNPILLDFNPYNNSSDPLLFTYEELHDILLQALSPPSPSASTSNSVRPRLPIIKVIDSQSHPEANRGMPAFGTNMMPVEVVEMSQGRGVGEFKDAWERLVREGMEAEGDSDSDSDNSDE